MTGIAWLFILLSMAQLMYHGALSPAVFGLLARLSNFEQVAHGDTAV